MHEQIDDQFIGLIGIGLVQNTVII